MKITILGKKWDFKFVNYLGPDTGGDVDSHDTKNKTMRIVKGLPIEEELRLIIHECLHAADWHRTEEFVDDVSTDIAKILIKLGYTKKDKEK